MKYLLIKTLRFWWTPVFLMAVWACSEPDSSDVLMTTNQGAVSIHLYEQTTKYHKNFVKLVEEGFYDSLLFHRVMADMMIQGGDPESKNAPSGKFLGKGNLDYTIQPDFRYVHTYGAVSAARLPDQVNPGKESSASQFFIVIGRPVTDEELNKIEKDKGFRYTPEQRRLYKLVGGIPQWDKEYSVFGEVTDGMEVVKKISRIKTDPNDRPVQDVLMTMKMSN